MNFLDIFKTNLESF